VVEEWQQSMHSRAHADADPLFGALLAYRVEREGEGLKAKCAQCHGPRGVEALDGPAARAGVSCAGCHNVAELHLGEGRKGAGALVWGPAGVLRGPHDVAAGASPAHGTGPRLEALADGRSLCVACHQEEHNKAGIPTCSTGLELPADGPSCVSCHMPTVEGASGQASQRPQHRSHAFAGPHRAWLQQDVSTLRAGVKLDLAWEGDAGAKVTLTNQSAHSFPTGFPGRMAVVFVRGLDAKGAEVWRNIQGDPMKEHPEAVLNKVYVGEDGQPTLPPYGVKLARDARLGPQETRAIALPKLPPEVVRLEATLKFWLIPPPAAKTLGVEALPEAKPVEVVKVEIAR
jgi:hypothetical protein